MNIKRLSLMPMLVAATLAVSAAPAASGWDNDDDIYYNPSTQPKKPAASPSTYVPNTVVDYPGADTYSATAGSGLNVDVDEYNRRGQFLVQTDTAAADTVGSGADTFAYTRRLERYYNPDIVNASGDSDLINYYYATEPASDINVYVVNAWPGYSSWYSPWYTWYSPSWCWNSWGWYDPWYSWSWGWGPSWSWGPAWGWGPSWGWNPGPGWGPGPAWRPGPGHWASSAGASRPHAPAGSGSSSTVGRRPGAISAGATGVANRPGNMGRGRYTGTTSPAGRPGTGSYSAPSVGGNNSGSNSNYGSGSFNRGRNGATNSNRQGVQNNNTRRQTPSYNNNYNSGSSSRGRSGYSTGGGSRSTHSSGGGSHSGGGGGGSRGRR